VSGQTAVCTVTNTRQQVLGPTGSLTIIKDAEGAGALGFNFDAGALGTFTLADGGSELFSELEAGSYTVTETAATGWEFIEVQCTAEDWQADPDGGASVTVNLAEGEAAVCTFTNGATEGPGELPYTGSQPFMLPLLIAGLWSVLMGLGLVVSSARKRNRA
jgi:LPXTG-motif cell wall-anchored protein